MGSDIQICSCQSDHAECLIAFVSRRKSLAWRPFTAVSFTFASNLLVFGSFLVAETTRDLGLLLVSVFHRNRVD